MFLLNGLSDHPERLISQYSNVGTFIDNACYMEYSISGVDLISIKHVITNYMAFEVQRIWKTLMLHGENKFTIFVLNDLDLVQSIDDIMRTKFVDLFTLVGGADGDDSSTCGDSGFDTTGGVLKDDGSLWVDAEVRCGKEERVGERLAALKTSVVGRHADFGDSDAGISDWLAVGEEKQLTWCGSGSRGSKSLLPKWPPRICPLGESRLVLGHPGGS